MIPEPVTAADLIGRAREYVAHLPGLLDAQKAGKLADPSAIDRTLRRTLTTLDHALDLLARPDPAAYPLHRGDHGPTWPYPACPSGGACED